MIQDARIRGAFETGHASLAGRLAGMIRARLRVHTTTCRHLDDAFQGVYHAEDRTNCPHNRECRTSGCVSRSGRYGG